MIDDILKKHGLTLDELNPEEKTTFYNMLNDVNKSTLTVDGLREAIKSMRSAVETEMVDLPFWKYLFKNVFLKARLKNYMQIEELLQLPVKQRHQLEKALEGFKVK